ncbi:hypothetical protein BN9982_110021 [Mycobacterium tuberculosis]|nr:hypothetical protein BN9982_110021 [Mycobacterium tuberculosis]
MGIREFGTRDAPFAHRGIRCDVAGAGWTPCPHSPAQVQDRGAWYLITGDIWGIGGECLAFWAFWRIAHILPRVVIA